MPHARLPRLHHSGLTPPRAAMWLPGVPISGSATYPISQPVQALPSGKAFSLIRASSASGEIMNTTSSSVPSGAAEITPPPRPKVDQTIIASAANLLCQQHGWPNEHACDIAAAYRSHLDGYELAKALESDHSWDINAETVAQLDDMSHLVRSALRDACITWAKTYAIAPPHPVGTMTTRGEITGISDHEPATYLIRQHGETNPNRSLLIAFEQAVLATCHQA